MSLMADTLFVLLPTTDQARAVVAANPRHQQTIQGSGTVLAFSAERPSKIEGRLVSFGRHPDNDIHLPSQPYPNERYFGFHMYFYLAQSGELLLRDLSRGFTDILLEDETPENQTLYALCGEPRQRVIPKGEDLRPEILLGTTTRFLFLWNKTVTNSTDLTSQAAALLRPGLTPTVQEPVPHIQPRYQLRSLYQPTVQPQAAEKDIHRYNVLGQGGYGIVYRAVDLSNGKLWAVKEIMATAKNDSWRQSLKNEVEMVHDLRHEHIVALEHFQGFRIGGRFQLFFRLCTQGNLANRIPKHTSLPWTPRAAPEWIAPLWEHVLRALQYLHGKGIIHCDVKPENILIDGDKFLLTDFGISMAAEQATATSKAGTAFFMAPEVADMSPATGPGSDIWSFAITVGYALGYWCLYDVGLSTAQWAEKLRSMGYTGRYKEKYYPGAAGDMNRWRERVLRLGGYRLLPAAFNNMLVQAGQRPGPATCLRMTMEDVTQPMCRMP